MKFDIKAKFARLNGRIFNDLYFGQTLNSGTLQGVYNDTTGAAIPARRTRSRRRSRARHLGARSRRHRQQRRAAAARGQRAGHGPVQRRSGRVHVRGGRRDEDGVHQLRLHRVRGGRQASVVHEPAHGLRADVRRRPGRLYNGKQANMRFNQCVSGKLAGRRSRTTSASPTWTSPRSPTAPGTSATCSSRSKARDPWHRITFGGATYTVPPLTLGALEGLQKRLEALKDAGHAGARAHAPRRRRGAPGPQAQLPELTRETSPSWSTSATCTTSSRPSPTCPASAASKRGRRRLRRGAGSWLRLYARIANNTGWTFERDPRHAGPAKPRGAERRVA
jgi:hypothetical protein